MSNKPSRTPLMRTSHFLALLLLGSALASQTPSIVVDFNRTPPQSAPSHTPEDFFLLDTDLVFMTMVATGTRDRELYAADPTDPTRTRLVKDINRGPASSKIRGFTRVSGPGGTAVVFLADNGQSGFELWKSDGTKAGTEMLTDVSGPNGNAFTGLPIAFRGNAYFTAIHPQRKRPELWVSDGTRDGTNPVFGTFDPAKHPVRPTDFAETGEKLFFLASLSLQPKQLFVSDGTAAGTRVVNTLDTGIQPNGNLTAEKTGANRFVFFSGNVTDKTRGFLGAEPCFTNGTVAGTRMLTDIEQGPKSSFPHSFRMIDTPSGPPTTVFLARRIVLGQSQLSMWKTRALQQPTRIVQGGPREQITDVTTSGSRILFVSRIGQRKELRMVSDVTFVDSTLIVGGHVPDEIVSAGAARGAGVFLFDLTRIGAGKEPTAVVAGSAAFAGTPRLAGHGTGTDDIQPGPPSSDPRQFRSFPDARDTNARITFFSALGPGGFQPWMARWDNPLDPATLRLTLLRQIQRGVDADPKNLAAAEGAAGSKLIGTADSGPTGAEPIVSNGTPRGTATLRDVRPGPLGSDACCFTNVAGLTMFRADPDGRGASLFRTNGTAAGTRDVAPSRFPRLDPQHLTSSGGRLFFAGKDAAAGREVRVYDPAPDTLRLFQDLNPGAADTNFTFLRVLMVNGIGKLIAGGDVPDAGLEFLAASVADAFNNNANTGFTIMDLRAGPLGSDPTPPVVCGDLMYFTADDGANGRELWVSDGTLQGTRVVKDIRSGPLGSNPRCLTCAVLGGKPALLLFADDGIAGEEPWISDGTAGGTALLANIGPGGQGARGICFVATAGRAFFGADDGTNGRELWSTDGTTAGTRMVANLLSFGDTLTPDHDLVAVGASSRVLFTAGRGDLFVSDGTQRGTRRLFARGVAFDSIHRAGDTFFITGHDSVKGKELFKLSTKDLEAAFADRYGLPCKGANGFPQIGTSGAPVIGSRTFAVMLRNGFPGASAALLLGAAARVPLPGGCEQLVGLQLALPAKVSTSGAAEIALPVPNQRSAIGGELSGQWAIVDPEGKALALLALSRGLRIGIGR